MKIWTLLENTADRPDVTAEHGLSLYIETGDRTILFDAGQSDAFAKNAEIMGVDLQKVDFAVLSHGHYDHGGGMETFLAVNGQAPLYVNAHSFGAYYNGTEKYIGLPESLRDSDRICTVDGDKSLAPGIILCGGAGRECTWPIDSFGLNEKKNGKFEPDRFLHEQYLLVKENGKRILFSGCSHRGILNIMSWFHPDVLIGGFHFKKLDPEQNADQLAAAARQLMQYDTVYYTCHCTGKPQYEYLKTIMGERLHYLGCGSTLQI